MLTGVFLIALLHVSMFLHHPLYRDSSVGTAIRYGMDGPGIESQWGRDFLTLPEVHPDSCTIGTGSFPRGRAAEA